MKDSEFKVGDTVYCAFWGKGKVSRIKDGLYPVEFEFPRGTCTYTVLQRRTYTLDGKYDPYHPRILFFYASYFRSWFYNKTFYS